MQTKSYTLAFLFNQERNHVLLMRKARPEWQKGFLNGVGGKVEPDETPRECIIREFKEETNLTIRDFVFFAELNGMTLDGEPYLVSVYRAFRPREFLEQAVTMIADEPLVIVPIDSLCWRTVIDNLLWLIPMALSVEKEGPAVFVIHEERDREQYFL